MPPAWQTQRLWSGWQRWGRWRPRCGLLLLLLLAHLLLLRSQLLQMLV